MSAVRQLMGVLIAWVAVALMLMFGIPAAVHLGAVFTPTNVDSYPWSTPELLGMLLRGQPWPSSTITCAFVIVVATIVLLAALNAGGFGWRQTGRASILRLRFTVWRKSKPQRQPLTAKAAEPLGRVGWFGFFGMRWFTDMLEDTRVVIAPSGSGKTTRLVVQLIRRATGAVVTTSTKIDVLLLTGWIRYIRFPESLVLVFDPEGLVPWFGKLTRTARVRWNIVAGCQDGQMAMKRAAAIVAARPMNGSESTNSGFFSQAVTIVLQCMLHAAAMKGLTMRDVMRWMNDFDDDTPYDILRDTPGALHGWEALLRKYCRGKADETISNTDMSASGILNAFAIESILDAVSPGPDDQVLDVTTFHAGTDTLYLICKGEKSPAAAVFTALVESLYLNASEAATRNSPLNPPLELALDEAANVCPIPSLALVMSTGRGEGIISTIVLQGLAQFVKRYGKDEASTIIDNATELLVLGGVRDTQHLKDLSELAGSLDTHAGGRGSQVMAPDKIRTLREGRALLFYRNLPSTIITLPAWWRSTHKAEYQAAMDWAQEQHHQHATPATEGVGAA
ncbi:type IV secretory system conjugative DNA transfer family protein [Plantibacter sp. CFBP 8804]|uniref:type IV secretory system conjugative DNA transfer family protein n=1 Tax=Plantibacter sp. CFBP 8804 TaxID=2775270 RepID=UPI00177BCC38|nr:type IV secretory system conjugative DNA transfer family protein [Plantibacter sp. CFBP 8804]MBD8519139.1 TraM recognition domain-containing protein [Plantibacter sp. CFBP 8804]